MTDQTADTDANPSWHFLHVIRYLLICYNLGINVHSV